MFDETAQSFTILLKFSNILILFHPVTTDESIVLIYFHSPWNKVNSIYVVNRLSETKFYLALYFHFNPRQRKGKDNWSLVNVKLLQQKVKCIIE